MTKGVLLFAHNNDVFPYHVLAPLCAWFIHRNMGVPVTVVADKHTRSLMLKEPLSRFISSVVEQDDVSDNGHRRYVSASGDTSDAAYGEFLNTDRVLAYDITPYDETLLMDLDYLVMDDSLNNVWGSDHNLLFNTGVDNITSGGNEEPDRLHPLGIKQYWSTVMYVKKSEEAAEFYEMLKYIRANYKYLSKLFRFDHKVFRIDHAVSIAAHWMGGLSDQTSVYPLPASRTLFAWDNNPVVGVEDNSLWFSSGGKTPHVVMSKNRSVHVMNKQSILEIILPWAERKAGV